MNTIAVTGAAGVVGSVLVEHLSRAGHRVAAIDHRAPPQALASWWQEVQSEGGALVTPIEADIRDASALTQIFGDTKVGGVIHMAAVTAGPERESHDPESIVDINVGGTLAVARAMRANGIQRLVHVSSNAVYGPVVYETDLIDEDKTVPRPAALYGVTKLAGEGLIRRLGDLWSMNVTIARLSSVFGPWEHATGVRDTLNPIFQATVAALSDRPARFTRPCRRDWIYNRDVADALVRLLSAETLKHPVYHVGPGPDAVWSVEDWCVLLAGRYPSFVHGLVDEPGAATINLHEPADRAPMSTTRLVADTGFQPSYTPELAFADMMAWVEKFPAFLHVPTEK